MSLLSTAVREHAECGTCGEHLEFRSCTLTGQLLQRCGCSIVWRPIPRQVVNTGEPCIGCGKTRVDTRSAWCSDRCRDQQKKEQKRRRAGLPLCRRCRRIIDQEPVTGRPAAYCSAECRDAARASRQRKRRKAEKVERRQQLAAQGKARVNRFENPWRAQLDALDRDGFERQYRVLSVAAMARLYHVSDAYVIEKRRALGIAPNPSGKRAATADTVGGIA